MAWSQGRSDRIPHVSEGPFSMEVIAPQNSSSGGHCVELQDGQKTKAKSGFLFAWGCRSASSSLELILTEVPATCDNP